MRQVVIYLRETASPLVYQNRFTLEQTQHQFELIRLWKQPTELFLQSPGLLPFAVLTASDAKADVLREISVQIETIAERISQSNVAAATSIMAGLVLEKDVIQRVLR